MDISIPRSRASVCAFAPSVFFHFFSAFRSGERDSSRHAQASKTPLDSLFMYRQHAPIPSKPLVPGSKHDPLDSDLSERRSAHDARFDGHVERGFRERVNVVKGRRGVVRVQGERGGTRWEESEDLVDRFEFGVPCCLSGRERRVLIMLARRG